MTTEERQAALLGELARSLDTLSENLRRLSGVEADDGRFITTAEVAARLQVNEGHVLTMTKAGLPHYRLGKSFTYRWPEVVAFMAKFRVEDTNWRKTA
jgi:hypothetical protein